MSCFVIFSFLSVSILIEIVVYFYMTDYDLTNEEAQSVIFRNRLIRAILSIVSLILVVLLSVLNTTFSIAFPAMSSFYNLYFRDPEKMKYDPLAKHTTKLGCFLHWSVALSLLILEIAFNIFRLVLFLLLL